MLAIAAFVALGHAAEPNDDLVKPTAIPSPLRVPREGRSESARAVQVSAACVTKSSFKIALPNGVVVTARRDHWTDCYGAMFAGGGIQGGTVHGASDSQAAYVKEAPVSTSDICATVYHCLGISPELRVPDETGRPVEIAHGGKPIETILA